MYYFVQGHFENKSGSIDQSWSVAEIKKDMSSFMLPKEWKGGNNGIGSIDAIGVENQSEIIGEQEEIGLMRSGCRGKQIGSTPLIDIPAKKARRI
jgi:hypothetical protein